MNNDIENRLQDVYRTNRDDAAALVKHFRETDDIENLQKAQADLTKWKKKLQEDECRQYGE